MALFTQITSAAWCHYITCIMKLWRLSWSKQKLQRTPQSWTLFVCPSIKGYSVSSLNKNKSSQFIMTEIKHTVHTEVALPEPFIRYLHFILPSTPGSSTLGYLRQINVSLLPFKHTRSWIFSSGPDQWPVRTLLRGHPGGHRGANQALARGSLVIMMQGIFFITIRWGETAWHGPQVGYSFLTASRSLQLQVCCI